jgi:hypothetical protein
MLCAPLFKITVLQAELKQFNKTFINYLKPKDLTIISKMSFETISKTRLSKPKD